MHIRQPEPYDVDINLPVFARIHPGKTRLFTVEDTVKCLLHPRISEKYICKQVPISISHNACFMVDGSKLGDPDDVSCDDMGTWKNNGVDTTHFRVKVNAARVVSVAKYQPNTRGAHTLKRIYRVHGTDESLQKITATICGRLV